MRSILQSRFFGPKRWPNFLLLLLISLGLTSTGALAQSTQVVGLQQATARGIVDAVRQNEEELINHEVFGGSAGGGALAIGVFPTGRLRTSDHDGLTIRPLVNTGVPDDGIRHTFSYKVDEGSAFGNAVITAPEKVLGGQLKFAGFVGGNWLSLDVVPNSANPGVPGTIGSGRNESVIVGGTVLWFQQTNYVLATVVGSWGNTSLTDKVGDFPNVHNYKFDTSGFISSLTAGKVFPLAGTSGPMLDLRGSVGYTQNQTDPFLNVFGDQFKVKFSSWTATAAVTVFQNITMQNSAVLRPFLQGYVRQEFGYDYKLAFTQSGSGAFTLTAYDQPHTYAGVDAGVSYVVKNMTLGASAYVEASSAERVFGARLRASWEFN
jgi:hypothetical protein